MENIKRPKKKSNILLCVVIALIVAIIAFIKLYNPTANAAPADTLTEEQQVEVSTLAKVGSEAPDFDLTMFDGSTVSLSSLRGKVVLLNFWATWCPPCREELKHVEKEIIKRFEGEKFVCLLVNRGDSRDKVEEFRKANGYTFPMGLDEDQSIYKLYASQYIPRNFVIDRNGRVVLATAGYEPDEFAELIATIESTINNK